jgi:hypothetical protein
MDCGSGVVTFMSILRHLPALETVLTGTFDPSFSFVSRQPPHEVLPAYRMEVMYFVGSIDPSNGCAGLAASCAGTHDSYCSDRDKYGGGPSKRTGSWCPTQRIQTSASTRATTSPVTPATTTMQTSSSVVLIGSLATSGRRRLRSTERY